MLKKTVTYTDPFTDEVKTEDFYFHLSKAELIEMEVAQKGGMQKHLERVIASEDGAEIMKEFKEILRRSYGEKKDGRFVKSEQAWEEFVSGEAYSNLFFELCTNAQAAIEFINGIIPRGLEAEAAKLAAAQSQGGSAGHPSDTAAQPAPETPALDKATTALATEEPAPAEPRDLTKATSDNPIVLTQQEIADMNSDELKSGLATGRYKLS